MNVLVHERTAGSRDLDACVNSFGQARSPPAANIARPSRTSITACM